MLHTPARERRRIQEIVSLTALKHANSAVQKESSSPIEPVLQPTRSRRDQDITRADAGTFQSHLIALFFVEAGTRKACRDACHRGCFARAARRRLRLPRWPLGVVAGRNHARWPRSLAAAAVAAATSATSATAARASSPIRPERSTATVVDSTTPLGQLPCVPTLGIRGSDAKVLPGRVFIVDGTELAQLVPAKISLRCHELVMNMVPVVGVPPTCVEVYPQATERSGARV